jgi:tRNA threonylcarbamoyladenosine biosynthesis protein TsaB
MNIIALDTASDCMHLAVDTGSSYMSMTKSAGRRFSEELVPQMIALCNDAQIKLSDLDLIVCANGPGSFTGLRVGMAAAKGVALGAGIPLVSISTMDIYQYPLQNLPSVVIPVLDAKKSRFYCAVFQNGERLSKDMDSTPEELCHVIDQFPEVFITGPDALKFSILLRQAINTNNRSIKVVADHMHHRDYGESLIQLGRKALEERGPDAISSGPTYIRKSEAELSLEERLTVSRRHEV